MGWTFRWASSAPSSFNYDYGASFTKEQLAAGPVTFNYKPETMTHEDREGISVFYKDASGAVYHTYSAYARGIDLVNTAYNYLDLTPGGRDEEGKPPQYWVRRHDRY
jgi:predicted dithiol-disulfide oxidoreductase (DUF899 family)